MRLIEIEKDTKQDNDAQTLNNLKSDILRIQKKIADLKVQIDDVQKSKIVCRHLSRF